MKQIRQKLFILSYIGNLLLITATFVPIVKFNNQTFAFIDQFFYLSFAVVILSTISLILTTMKKFKLSLIPTILNMIIIAYGIYSILTIDRINIIKANKESGFNYGIAFWLYPIGIVLNIVGGILAKGNNTKKKEKRKKEKEIQPQSQINTNLNIEEPIDISDDPVINLDYEEQIPLSNLLNKNDSNNISQDEIINDSNNGDIDADKILVSEAQDNIQNNDLKNDQPDNKNDILDDSNETTDDNIIIVNPEQNDIQNSNNVENISILSEDDELLEEIEEFEYTDDDFFEEITEEEIPEKNDEIITIPSINEETLVDDINDNLDIDEPDIVHNLDAEIPDIDLNNENIMTNNTQVADEPKPEFMALNPSDIKIDNKKPLFKKKEKKEEDPLERIMKRNIPTTLGRTCQFCSTPLGDDERICPICGRIN